MRSNYEASSGNKVSRDCGFSRMLPSNAGLSTWLFCDTGIDDPGDVHFVQIKCPLLTADRIAAAAARGAATATRDTLKSMALSRGAVMMGG